MFEFTQTNLTATSYSRGYNLDSNLCQPPCVWNGGPRAWGPTSCYPQLFSQVWNLTILPILKIQYNRLHLCWLQTQSIKYWDGRMKGQEHKVCKECTRIKKHFSFWPPRRRREKMHSGSRCDAEEESPISYIICPFMKAADWECKQHNLIPTIKASGKEQSRSCLPTTCDTTGNHCLVYLCTLLFLFWMVHTALTLSFYLLGIQPSAMLWYFLYFPLTRN